MIAGCCYKGTGHGSAAKGILFEACHFLERGLQHCLQACTCNTKQAQYCHQSQAFIAALQQLGLCLKRASTPLCRSSDEAAASLVRELKHSCRPAAAAQVIITRTSLPVPHQVHHLKINRCSLETGTACTAERAKVLFWAAAHEDYCVQRCERAQNQPPLYKTPKDRSVWKQFTASVCI